MPEFAFTARNLAGEDVHGSIPAGSKREALRVLSQRSLFPLKVEDVSARKGASSFHLPFGRRVKAELLASNLTQLADLLENGVPLLTSLKILADQCAHPVLSEVFTEVHDQVAEGMSLDVALSRHPRVFSELTISMVRAGSEGAFLEDALKRVATFLELQEELKGRVVGAMAYPAFLAVAGVVVTLVLVVFFVPKFDELFARLERQGTGLPIATIVLLAVSDFLIAYGWLVAAGLVALVALARKSLTTERGKLLADRWKLKLPVAGPIFHNTAVSRFCRVLGTLLRNGVPILKALEISSASAGNRILAQAIVKSAENISSGETLSKPLAECGLIPRPIMAMISVAEESNNLDHVLVNIANRIDSKVERQLTVMVRLVEPVMLVMIGGMVLFVLVALLLPVFDMSSAIS
jgi:general secretion pathway protein F/type IV pilus assembly protein PilC